SFTSPKSANPILSSIGSSYYVNDNNYDEDGSNDDVNEPFYPYSGTNNSSRESEGITATSNNNINNKYSGYYSSNNKNEIVSFSSYQERRMASSVPTGIPMNFRIAAPIPKTYYDPNGILQSSSDESEIESDSDILVNNDEQLNSPDEP